MFIKKGIFLVVSVAMFCSYSCTDEQVIYLDWFGDGLRNDKLFELPDSEGGNEWKLLRKKLKIKNIKLTTYPYKGPNKAANIYCGTKFDIPPTAPELFSLLNIYGQDKLAVFLWEPPSVKPYNFNKASHQHIKTIFTLADDLIDNEKYFKFFYPQPQSVNVEKVAYEKKQFCCSMVANKKSTHVNELYTERLKTIMYFERVAPELHDLYGPGWQGLGLKTYKGYSSDKLKTLAHYKFCICYENIKDISGYVSEKIHHCLLTGCVPIYWGASNITDYVPVQCFIDRRNFKNNEELLKFLLAMTQEEYEAYLDAAKKYLLSTQQMLFSDLYFADCCLKGFTPFYNRAEFFNREEVLLLEEIDAMQQKIIERAQSC